MIQGLPEGFVSARAGMVERMQELITHLMAHDENVAEMMDGDLKRVDGYTVDIKVNRGGMLILNVCPILLDEHEDVHLIEYSEIKKLTGKVNDEPTETAQKEPASGG